MKMRIRKMMLFLLTVMLLVPMLSSSSVAMAKVKNKHNPKLTCSKKTLTEKGETFKLSVKDVKGKVKKITWSSLNDKVATVQQGKNSKTVTVISGEKGNTRIKCTIYFHGGIKYTAYCKVTVIPAATKIEISKVYKDTNGRHIIAVGQSYDFDSKLTPKGAGEQTFWSIDKPEYAKVNKNGTVTGLKPGIVNLTATAAKSQSKVASSTVKDTISIEIVKIDTYEDYNGYSDYWDSWDDSDYWDHWDFYNEWDEQWNNQGNPGTQSFNVKDVKLSGKTINITFDKPINSSTVIGYNNALLNSVTITPKLDSYNVMAGSTGNLTATLSNDGKVLTIQAANNLSGVYGIRLMSSIKSTDGSTLKEYNKDLAISDKNEPSYINYTLDKSGLIVTMNFDEVMDFSKMSIVDVKAADKGQTLTPETIKILSTSSNYAKSADGKSLTINLTGIPATDKSRKISIRLVDVKDMAGNSLKSSTSVVVFSLNPNQMPQAKPVAFKRTNYNTLAVTFDREIQTPGYVLINNEWIPGGVDANNPFIVNYTLTPTATLLNGNQKVSIGYWNSYNVKQEDKSAEGWKEYYVNFTL